MRAKSDTPAPQRNREAKTKERQLKRDAGLVPIEIWIKPQYKKAIRDYAETLNKWKGRDSAPN